MIKFPGKALGSIFIILLFAASAGASRLQASRPADYVNPFIGTAGFGHTFPGATVPFGMVQLSPDTRSTGWENCSGYHSSNPTILGFSHTHLSGTGCPDFGDILIIPTTGDVQWDPGDESRPATGYRSAFQHTNETALPGYYKVLLDDHQITAELTATERCGIHRYTFPKATKTANILIDLAHGIGDRADSCELSIINHDEIAGFRRSRGWAVDQKVYFAGRFNRPFVKIEKQAESTPAAPDKFFKTALQFDVSDGGPLILKLAISYTDVDGARRNLDAEAPDFDFNKIRADAAEKWNAALSKVKIDGSADLLTIFYTALYHCFIAPNLLSDVDRRHRGIDGKVYTTKRPVYHVFSLWDTFRALHPLFTILDPERNGDFVNSLLVKYQESGTLPVWELASNETNCMIGYHSIPVIVDAYIKGFRDFDTNLALEAITKSADEDRLGLKYYKSIGYIPVDKENEGVSKALEYSYDDWCIVEFAAALGARKEAFLFRNRAKSYINNFDASTGFMRAKKSGSWAAPFDPAEVNGHFTEANAWQYSFFAPHDVTGLIQLMGGDEKFINKLELLFTTDPKVTGREQLDISGLVGQYAHGNEPSHHVAYLFNYAGAPWRTQRRVREIISKFYNTSRDGVCGNDDCGQMSAWCIFSMLGFYPVAPGRPEYAIGSPSVAKASIAVMNNKTFSVVAENQSEKNIYIQSASLNGKPLERSYITHDEIMGGGELILQMGPEPNLSWAADPSARPRSEFKHEMSAVPFVVTNKRTFTDPIQVELSSFEPNATLYYSTDQTFSFDSISVYESPIEIGDTTTLHIFARAQNKRFSFVDSVRFIKLPYTRTVNYKYPFSHLYTGGGDQALVDGVRAEAGSFGEWQGFEGTNFEAVVDLGEARQVTKISSRYLQNYSSWIFLPTSVEYFISEDGEHYQSVTTLSHDVPPGATAAVARDFDYQSTARAARFVKVVATTLGKCPAGHPGAGGKCWIFVDEITIE